MSTWSAPVRYGECDQQGVVFNAHYLLYCDEALAAYCAHRGLPDLAEAVHLVTSTLTWRSPARWGETVDVDVRCTKVGRTSFDLTFEISVGQRRSCTVTTVYVNTDGSGHPEPLPQAARDRLS
ncbi:acyl-CoA thioesterase [uncultured Jatrophihabitans sp.]|uniref:acyl-CoA thioesterase n=1 Tax=uncultured Jatrophihabitans sp. TaxID=1610747 RepID=UPI0035CB0953